MKKFIQKIISFLLNGMELKEGYRYVTLKSNL
jgi:hypothetical protein